VKKAVGLPGWTLMISSRRSKPAVLLLQPTKGRGVKRKSPTKLVAAAQDVTNEEADIREDEHCVGVEESAVVNAAELPNFQID